MTPPPVAIATLMDSSGVAFGTSGARGLVTAMTDQVCFAYVRAFLQHMAKEGQFAPGTHVAIAGDLRPSTPRIKAACAAAIIDAGGVVDDCGYVPSPAVAGYGFARAIPSVMVTGSHIPDDRNGIKFNRADGEILKPDETAMRAETVTLPPIFDDAGMLLSPPDLGPLCDAATSYVARYQQAFGPDALTGLKLGVYEHSAVGRDIVVAIIEALGGAVVRLGRSEKFIPVDTEAVRPEDQILGRQWAAEYGLDGILSTDGDSDRPLLADASGTWLRGDVLGILCAQALGMEAVVTPVSSNSALELSGLFKLTGRSRIGSPFVIAMMNGLIADGAKACGYEANGGFILGSDVAGPPDGLLAGPLPALPTRDAVLPMVAVLAEAKARGLSLAGFQALLPPRFTHSDRLKDYPTATSRQLLADLEAGTPDEVLAHLTTLLGALSGTAVAYDSTDGLRTTFDSGEIIHLRPSGNAPELRCYTEADTPERAEALNVAVLALIRN